MKRSLLVALIISITLFMACTDEGRIERREDKLEGTWEFETARFRESWELFGDDMMHRYSGDLITFYPDGRALYDDFQLKEQFEGNWEIVIEYDYDSEGDEERFYYLDMYFYETGTGEIVIEQYAEIRYLTQNTLKLSVWEDRGEYRFKMKKL